MALFEEYKNHPDESVRERTTNWAIAIGLQCVDGLNVSDFLIQVARQEIEGKITMNEAQTLIDEHYTQNRFRSISHYKNYHSFAREKVLNYVLVPIFVSLW
jgi:hypothetical protein